MFSVGLYIYLIFQKALYFPDIAGTPLTGGDKVHTTDLLMGKVTILSILSSKISEVREMLSCRLALWLIIGLDIPSGSLGDIDQTNA